jgi:two-component system, LytTR family, sensor kinase
MLATGRCSFCRVKQRAVATDPIILTAPAPGEPAKAPPAPKPARRASDRKAWTPFRLQQQPFFEDKNRAFWILQSAGWAGYFVLRTLSGIANAMGWSFVIHTALLTGTGYSITLLMAAAFRRLIMLRPIVTWAISIVLVLIASAGFSAIETWSHATFVRPGARPEGVEFLGAILLDFSILAAWSALYFGINYYLLLEEQTDQLLRLEHQASAAQLAMLRYQLNPHFLFNTLNSISTLVLLKQTDRANAMLSRLSSFLRYTLVNEPTGQVTLVQEVETLKLYLEIEKMRFEERLRPKFHIDPAAAPARLPSLLLQPLVENAIKYAVTPKEEGADIAIDARRLGDKVLITVSDTGPGADGSALQPGQSSTGVGLANIRDRLAQAYGADQRFETQTNISGGFSVSIEIPFQTEASSEDKK